MQKPFPTFDTLFDSNKDYDRRPVGSHDYAHITQQQWNNSGNSQPHPQLFDSQAAGASSEQFTPQPVRGSMLLQPQAVDNIDMTQHQRNDRTTPQQPFHPHGVGGPIPTALPGNTHTSTTTTPLPGNNTHRGMSYTTPTMTPITPATATSKAVSGCGIQPTLQNIVATVNLCCKLDLKLIVQKARNAEYNPKRFSAVIMRIREPRTTALIFSSGKMVCTGATSVELSRLAARKFARAVQKLGFPAKFLDFKVQNMVGSCDVKFPVRLETLFFKHQRFSSYEPETFPGLIYKMIEPRINLLIFVSGKVVLTGAKTREDINQAFENIYPILKSFEKIRHETFNSTQTQVLKVESCKEL